MVTRVATTPWRLVQLQAEKIADNLVDVALEEENPRLALVKVLKGAAATAATTTGASTVVTVDRTTSGVC